MPCPDFEDETSQQFSLMIAKAADPVQNPILPGKPLTIIEPRDPTRSSAALGSRIALGLDESEYRCNLHRWGDELKHDAGDEFIVLGELDNAILPTLTVGDFDFIKNLISKASSILWVTSSGNPTADLRFRTLQAMSKSHEVPDRLATHIVKLTTHAKSDDEYLEQFGVLKVSRAFQNGPINVEVSAYLHGGKVELMPLGKAQGPQKIHVAVPGMLDSLQVKSDGFPATGLESCDVEIEVKVTGIK